MSGKKRRLRDANRKQAIGILLLLVAFAVGYTILADSQETIRIAFERPDGSKTKSLKVTLAATARERQKGLMFVKDMPEDSGLLFAFPEQTQQKFWMKNTYLPLDMIFMDTRGKVVGILHDVPPLNTISRTIPAPSRYVLELNGGRARQLRISEDSMLEYPGALPEGR